MNYVVICPGSAKRAGAGLAVMAGLAIETQILDMFRMAENSGSWTVNRIVQAHDKSAGLQKRGVLGRPQQAALLIYRGTWPNRMAAEARDNFGGAVSDDIWYRVPCLNRIQL